VERSVQWFVGFGSQEIHRSHESEKLGGGGERPRRPTAVRGTELIRSWNAGEDSRLGRARRGVAAGDQPESG